MGTSYRAGFFQTSARLRGSSRAGCLIEGGGLIDRRLNSTFTVSELEEQYLPFNRLAAHRALVHSISTKLAGAMPT